MSIEEPLRLSIAVDRDAAPVSGRVIAAGGSERAFSGWTELFAALQVAIAGNDREEKDRC
jgi:hypothetical protein